MICRRIEPDDVEQVINIGEDMHKDSKYAHIPYDRNRLRLLARDAMEQKFLHAWVVIDDDSTVAGMICIACMNYYFSNLLTANDLLFYVRPSSRSLHAVHMLIKAAEDWCRNNNIHSLTLCVTAPKDHRRVGRICAHFGYNEWGTAYRKELV